MTVRATRLAPSPTGSLHLGNARTFVFTWALARRLGWSVRLRIEDLDRTRVRPGATDEAVAVLRWLGLDWDGPMLVQSADLEPYRAAMRTLADRGLVFRCARTRREVAALGAPHAEDAEVRFVPELRPADPGAWTFADDHANHRLRLDPGPEPVHDEIAGDRVFDPGLEIGDLLVWTRLGVPAYQLAVVVDDARTGITDVVRGDDLLASAARQAVLHRHLGRAPPRWWHLPLVAGPDGARLAKRHGENRLQTYRAAGVPARRVVGLLAHWCGLAERGEEIDAEAFRARLDPARLHCPPVRFTEEDHRWLMDSAP